MTILQASFFWKNNVAGGLGFTFGPPAFSSTDLSNMFEGPQIKKFMCESDAALGTQIIKDYLDQLALLSAMQAQGKPLLIRDVILAALNIMWLSSRGFIPNDEFNGVQFISHLPVAEPNRKTPS